MTDQPSQIESPPKQKRLCRWAVQGLVFLLVTWWLPAWWCGRGADVWFAGEAQQQAAMLASIEHWVDRELSSDDFGTGSELFNGEWLFGTYMMAAMGANIERGLQLAMKNHLLAAGALVPKIVRHVLFFDEGSNLWADIIGEPIHERAASSTGFWRA